MRFDRHDTWDQRWWPQGVTTVADAGLEASWPRVAIVSWFSQKSEAFGPPGSRISLIDLESRRYEHIALVDPELDGDSVIAQPLAVHAGGIIWTGDHLDIAATRSGIVAARPADVVELAAPIDGMRFALPIRTRFASHADGDAERLRVSFLGLDRDGDVPSMLTGEYGVGAQSTRLSRFHFDGLRPPDDAPPIELGDGVERMQGAVRHGGTWYVTVSNGPWKRGSVFIGTPGELVEQPAATPPGPEDLSVWPSEGTMWSVSEFPGWRWLYAMPLSRLMTGPQNGSAGY